MQVLVGVVIFLNALFNAVFGFLFAPVAWLPGWLSITIISGVVGVALLYVYKWTSNQEAIGKVRDSISANLLALKLYKDSLSVTLKAQGRVFWGAFGLLFHSLRPMAVMLVPVVLLLSQMGAWYQFAPVVPGDEVLVKASLDESAAEQISEVRLIPGDGVRVTLGPVRVYDENEVYWKVAAQSAAAGELQVMVAGENFGKTFHAGGDISRISPLRPGYDLGEVILYPLEKPFRPGQPVRSISIEYPERSGYISGADWWIVYFFIASMVIAFVFKPLIKVRL